MRVRVCGARVAEKKRNGQRYVARARARWSFAVREKLRLVLIGVFSPVDLDSGVAFGNPRVCVCARARVHFFEIRFSLRRAHVSDDRS